VRSIPPPGQSIDSYPPTLLTPTQLEIREKAKLLSKYNTNKEAILKALDQTIDRSATFWTSNFGLDPKNGMITSRNASGEPIKATLFVTDRQTDGSFTLPTLSPTEKIMLADEIMSYPYAADYDLKQEDALVVVSAIPQWFNIESKIKILTEKIKSLAESVIYRLESKPDPDSFKIFFEGQTSIPDTMTRVMSTPLTPNLLPTKAQKEWGYVTLMHNFTGSTPKTSASKASMVRNKTNLSKVGESSPWSADITKSGINYHVKAILDFYFEAYSGEPKDFWNTVATHRLSVDYDITYNPHWFVVRIAKVNPNTGAALKKGAVVATGRMGDYYQGRQNHSERLLSEVQQEMFPDIVASVAGQNPKILTGTEAYYAESLLKAQQTWKATPNKANTPIVSIILHDWNMGIVPTYRDNDKRRVILSRRNDKSVTARGPISKMPVAPPNTLRVMLYLQTPGTEKAIEKILVGSDQSLSAIESWFVSHMGAVRTVSASSKERYERTTKAVYAILEHPWIYMRSYLDLLNYTPRVPGLTIKNKNYETLRAQEIFGFEYAKTLEVDGIVPKNDLNKLLADIKVIFKHSGWPEMPPIKLFSGPINDEKDLLFIRTKLDSALEGPDYPKPREMYLPESTNRGLKLSAVDYSFSNGSGVPFKRNSKRYMYNSGHVYYHSRYVMNGTTIRTKTRIGKIQPMTDLASKARKGSALSPLGEVKVAGTVSIIGGALALTALGFVLNKNR